MARLGAQINPRGPVVAWLLPVIDFQEAENDSEIEPCNMPATAPCTTFQTEATRPPSARTRSESVSTLTAVE